MFSGLTVIGDILANLPLRPQFLEVQDSITHLMRALNVPDIDAFITKHIERKRKQYVCLLVGGGGKQCVSVGLR